MQELDGAEARRRTLGTLRPIQAPGLEGGVRPPAPLPLLFSSASSLSTPPSRTSRGVGGGGRQALGERAPRLQPRLAMRGSPPTTTTIVPRGWGGGGCSAEISPAPPAATQEASGAAPAVPPRIRTLAATTPTPQRTAGGGGGPAYRDVRNALLALVRHGPAGALGPAGGPVGLSFARSGSQPVPLPAGAVTKARKGRREG